MAKEIERKFLLDDGTSIPIPAVHSKLLIKQAYIMADKGKQVRIRITTNPATKESYATLGIKFTKTLVRDEYELPMDLKEAKDLYKKCETKVEKHRLSFSSNGVHYDVDTYPNGVVFVEVEFKSL